MKKIWNFLYILLKLSLENNKIVKIIRFLPYSFATPLKWTCGLHLRTDELNYRLIYFLDYRLNLLYYRLFEVREFSSKKTEIFSFFIPDKFFSEITGNFWFFAIKQKIIFINYIHWRNKNYSKGFYKKFLRNFVLIIFFIFLKTKMYINFFKKILYKFFFKFYVNFF